MAVQFSNFKTSIKEFLRLDEEIRSLSKAKIERMRARDKLSKEIMGYYKNNNIHSLDLNFDGAKQQLELIESTRHPSVNQKFLREALNKYCNNDKIVDNMIDHILGQREQATSVSFKLKRVMPRTKKTSDSNSSNKLDPMKLTEKYENDKIKDRFAKLAEYAIIKDGVKKDNNKDSDDIIENNEIKEVCNVSRIPILENVETKNECIIDNKVNKVNKNIKDNKYDESKKIINDINDCDEDEEDVDLDEIPEEETGYVNQLPKLEEELDEKKTFRSVICQKLDSTDIKSGSIPQLTQHAKVIPPPNLDKKPTENILTQKGKKIENEEDEKDEKEEKEEIDMKNIKLDMLKELEIKALESWKQLDSIAKKMPILDKWLLLQKEKIKFLKTITQFEPHAFKLIMLNIQNKEKEYERFGFSNEINILRSYIVKYIDFRFSKS